MIQINGSGMLIQLRRPFFTGTASGLPAAQQFRSALSQMGLVSRVSPVHTAVRNCTRDEGGPFGIGNQLLISSHRKLLWSKATVVNVAEKAGTRIRQA